MVDVRRRFWFVTGKGGVGKSTVATALALSLSLSGRRVLLCTTADRTTVARLLFAALGRSGRLEPGKPIEMAPGLSTVHIDPLAAVVEYGSLILRNRWAAQKLFGNRAVERFVDAVPGIRPWAILGKAMFHSRARNGNSDYGPAERFDAVVLDAPATGHALHMLRVPAILSELGGEGALARDAALTWRLLRDPAHTAVVLVSLPEELPTHETIELAQELVGLGLSLGLLVINRMPKRCFSEDQARELSALPTNGEAEQPDRDARCELTRELDVMAFARQQALEQLRIGEKLGVLHQASELSGVRFVELPQLSDADPERLLRELAEQLGSQALRAPR